MVTATPRVGVLALQGDFREHQNSLKRIGVETILVRSLEDLALSDALVIPGGESTTIAKLADRFGLLEPIRRKIKSGLPVYGSCAGLILLSDTILDGIEGQQTFGGLNITVRRNAFGTQVDSFETEVIVPKFGDIPSRAVFIRAPIVVETGPEVEILAKLPDQRIIAVQQGKLIGTSFHPELTEETRFHELLVSLIPVR